MAGRTSRKTRSGAPGLGLYKLVGGGAALLSLTVFSLLFYGR